MSATRQKQERVIEAVRRGLEGDDAVQFIQQSGFAITPVAIARHLRTLGGRENIQKLIHSGKSNHEILEAYVPAAELKDVPVAQPAQPELFEADATLKYTPRKTPSFESTKITVTVPSELHMAIKLAARAEGKSRRDLIVEILEAALSRVPRELPPDDEAEPEA